MYPPVQDLPAHAAMIAVLSDPGGSVFWETAGPLTHSWLPYLLGAAAAPVAGAFGAAVLLLGLAAVAWPAAVLALSRAVRGDRVFALCAAGLAWGQVLVLGFVPFSLASAAALFGVALLSRPLSPPLTFMWSVASAFLVWSLHGMGLVALAAGVVLLVRPPGRAAVALAGLVPAGLVLVLSRDSGGGFEVAWGAETWHEHLTRLLLSLGPGSAAGAPDIMPALVVALASGLAFARRTPGGPPRAPAAALALFVAGASLLPDLVLAPSIVLATTRFLPFFAGLALACAPRVTAPWRAAAVTLAMLSLGWSTYLMRAEGARLAPEAAAIRDLEPGHRVLAAGAHRARDDSLLTSYSGIHLPMLYQAAGRGEVLAAFSHGDSPLRLRPEAAAVVDLAGRDVVAYVRTGARVCDRLLADAGDVPGFAEAVGADLLPPCEHPVPFPWVCKVLRPGPVP